MGKNVPTEADYFKKHAYIIRNSPTVFSIKDGVQEIMKKATRFNPEKTNLFKMYVSGMFPPYV